ncbi:MAG: hypothetical protein J6B60_00180 [Clostridia bacterium]|nr:hypothetical protein [Clostridia bacterium]
MTTDTIISISIYASFAVALLFGFLRGLRKGLYKSLVDLALVFVCAALSVFTVKIIASALTDSGAILSILEFVQGKLDSDSSVYTTIGDIIHYIETLPAEKNVAGGIMTLPVAILSPIIFMIVYTVIELLLKIPKFIIVRVVLGPNKGPGYRGGSRAFGGLVCAICAFLSLAIYMVPAVGYVNLTSDVLTTISATDTESTIAKSSDEGSWESTGVTAEIANTCMEIKDEYITPITNNFVVKTIHTCGGKWLFNNISTARTKHVTVQLDKELNSLANIYSEVTCFIDTPSAEYSDEQQKAVKNIVAEFSKTSVIPYIASTGLTYVSESWLNGDDVFGIEKINVGEALQPKVDSALLTISTMTPDTIKEDISTAGKIMNIFIKEGFFREINGGDIYLVLGNEEFFENVFYELYDNERTRPLLPDLSNTVIEYLYDVYNDVNDTDLEFENKLDFETISREEIGEEGARIASIIRDVKTFIDNTNLEEPDPHVFLINTDVRMAGRALDNLKASLFFGGETFDFLVEAVLRSEGCSNYVFSEESFIQILLDENASIEEVLAVRQQLAIIALTLNSNDPDDVAAYHEAIRNIISGVDANNTEVLKQTLTTEMLKSSGMEDKEAEDFSMIFSSIIDTVSNNNEQFTESEMDKEVEAVDKLLNIVNKVNDPNSGVIFDGNTDLEEEAGITAPEFVETVMDSTIISSVVENSTVNENGELQQIEGLSDVDSAKLKDAMSDYYSQKSTGDAESDKEIQKTIDSLGSLFGIDTSDIYQK